VVERAVKFARREGRKVRVMPERSCKTDEQRLKRYFDGLRTEALPFDRQSSAGYAPLTPNEFVETLHELRFKSKSSPLGQIADLYLWPIALAGYDDENRPYRMLFDSGRLIENRIAEQEAAVCGSKYSCFELMQQSVGRR
jgi:hypothetical protein